MIRLVQSSTDAQDITSIYNWYIENTMVSFEIKSLSVSQMQERINSISKVFPYFVFEEQGEIVGYAYAHQWKERDAYCNTLESTIYLKHGIEHRGIGTSLMLKLIAECRLRGYKVLIACITGNNLASIEFHKKLGFRNASLFHNVGNKFGHWLDVIDMEYQL